MLVDAFVGRQPIFDRDWSLYAYEVLYRSGSDNRAQFTNASAATSQVLVGTFIDIDIEKILGPNTGFVNMSREFLVDRFALAFPPDRMVVEVLEDVELDDEVLAVLTELSEGGYRISGKAPFAITGPWAVRMTSWPSPEPSQRKFRSSAVVPGSGSPLTS